MWQRSRARIPFLSVFVIVTESDNEKKVTKSDKGVGGSRKISKSAKKGGGGGGRGLKQYREK